MARDREKYNAYQREWKRKHSLAFPSYRKDYARQEQKDHPELVRERRRRHNRSLKGRFTGFKKSAKQRHLDVSISIEQFAAISLQPCRYCGGKLPEAGSGIDRIDSTQGYTIENCAPCCTECNLAKRNMTEIEFKDWILRVVNYYINGRK